MPTTITPLNKFTTPITVPVDGDPVTFAQREPSLQALSDRTQFLYYRGKAEADTLLRQWRNINVPVTGNVTPAAYAPSIHTVVGFCGNATSKIQVSTDYGDTWAGRTTMDANTQVSDFAWSPTLNIFVAVGFGGTVFAASSPDGLTWTARTLASHNWRTVIWVPSLALFVALGGNSTVDVGIATSPDGITWTNQTSPATVGLFGAAWSPTLSKLIVCVNDASGIPKFLSSANGTSWTLITLPAAAGAMPNSIDWSPDLGMFVAASSGGGTYWWSTDGVAWTSYVAANGAQHMRWVPELQSFIGWATGLSGAASVTASLDGLTWSPPVRIAVAVTINPSRWLWLPEISRFLNFNALTL